MAFVALASFKVFMDIGAFNKKKIRKIYERLRRNDRMSFAFWVQHLRKTTTYAAVVPSRYSLTFEFTRTYTKKSVKVQLSLEGFELSMIEEFGIDCLHECDPVVYLKPFSVWKP